MVADTHNDLLMCVAARPVAAWGSFFAERWLPQLRDGGVDLQVLPVFIDDELPPRGFAAADAADDRVRPPDRRGQRRRRRPVPRRRRDRRGPRRRAGSRWSWPSRALRASTRTSSCCETLFRLGVRIASLAHFGRTPLADGSAEDATGSRLTRAGVEAVGLMERLGHDLRRQPPRPQRCRARPGDRDPAGDGHPLLGAGAARPPPQPLRRAPQGHRRAAAAWCA